MHSTENKLSYRQLQQILKVYKEEGYTGINLNRSYAELEAEHQHILNMQELNRTAESRYLKYKQENIPKEIDEIEGSKTVTMLDCDGNEFEPVILCLSIDLSSHILKDAQEALLELDAILHQMRGDWVYIWMVQQRGDTVYIEVFNRLSHIKMIEERITNFYTKHAYLKEFPMTKHHPIIEKIDESICKLSDISDDLNAFDDTCDTGFDLEGAAIEIADMSERLGELLRKIEKRLEKLSPNN
jgi:hypothetical protein